MPSLFCFQQFVIKKQDLSHENCMIRLPATGTEKS